MKLSIIAGLFVLGGIVATAIMPSAIAQPSEVRGTYVVRIPPGATEEGGTHYEPANIAIPAGTTIVWFNDDTDQPHTVTSGASESEDSGSVFDSGFMSVGAFFQHTFEEAGDFDYHCEVHPWASGSVSVSDSYEEGHNFTLTHGTGPIFDFTQHERNLLVFEPTSVDIPEDEPVTYQVTILKDAEEVFTDEFRTLGGMLYLELIPTDGETLVTGPDISDPVIGAYHVSGSFLKDNAAYTIRTEITHLFDREPETPIIDEFGVQIVPEFPVGVMLTIAAGVGATIFAGRRFRK
jgi:plastocyanin